MWKSVSILTLIALFLMQVAVPSGRVFAGGDDSSKPINPPPFDFADSFYKENGIDLDVLNSPDSQRFGRFRQTGPPAPAGQVNWVIDSSNTSPVRNDVRILATTGAYKDDTGSPDQFFSIIAFAKSDKFFTGKPNKRGITMEEIVGVPNALCPPGVMCKTPPPLPDQNPLWPLR